MDSDVDDVLEALKKHLRVSSDAELARSLRVNKRTVSAWRARKKVPARYVSMLEGQSSLPVAVGPVYWSGHEEAAFALALFRYSRAFQNELNGENFSQALRVLINSPSDFWELMRQAQLDLSRVDDVNSPSAAIAVLLHEDIENGAAANESYRDVMRENRPSIVWTDGTETDAKGKPVRFP